MHTLYISIGPGNNKIHPLLPQAITSGYQHASKTSHHRFIYNSLSNFFMALTPKSKAICLI